MRRQLVAVSGKNKGAAWPLTDQGLVLGRDEKSDVVLADPIASRRHCRVYQNGEQALFEDLGSRNPALINGAPVREAQLKPGDEIAIGRQRFVLSQTFSHEEPGARDISAIETLPWEKGEALCLDVGSAETAIQGRPHTVDDLSMLYEVSRELGACTALTDLLCAVQRILAARFRPQETWIALGRGEDELIFYENHRLSYEPKTEAPLPEIREALCSRRGLLVPTTRKRKGKKERLLRLVAPVVLGDVNLGALALQAVMPQGAFDEDDLLLLVLLAQSLAPVLYSAQSIERIRRDNELLRTRSGESWTLVGTSRAIRRVRAQIAKSAKSELPVLITGETGTGKELAARMLHRQSGRADGPFVVVNCAAIPRELFESQLFGHEKGAFTGATEASVGLLSEANGGILFLDEIGDLSADNQARILRAIETGTFRRVGAAKETRADIRVVAATNTNLEEAVNTGGFREDLFHRLNGFEIHIPPLRNRPSDVPVLAQHFFEMARHEAKHPLEGIAPDAMHYLCAQAWPGNVRELRNRVLRAVSIAQQDLIQLRDVSGHAQIAGAEDSSEEFLSLAELEKRHIAKTLRKCGGRITETAKALEIGRTTLYRKLSKYGIE